LKAHKYVKLAELLASEIKQGHWQHHDKLPSVRALAQQHQLAKISVLHALQLLEMRGLVYAKPKSGYYVAPIKTASFSQQRQLSKEAPKHVQVPDVFFDIMQRSAAFDIYPQASSHASQSKYIQSLNRNISRVMRQQSQINSQYYGSPTGDDLLKEQVALRYQRRGLSVSSEDVCITSGCQNALYLALVNCCSAGDIVAVESPAFYGVLQLLHHLKLKIIEIPSSYTQGIDVEQFKQAVNAWPVKACILTPSFATPTGATMPEQAMKALLDIAVERNITIIEDDIYGELGFHHLSRPLKIFDNDDRVMLCGSVSKSLSRDLRIGWVISNKHSKAIAHTKLVNHLSDSQAIQKGLAHFIADGSFERHLQQYRRQLLTQREQLLEAINQYWHFNIRYTVPEGGLALWLELPECIDSIKLYNQALEAGIVVTPGRLFSTDNKFNQYLRLSFSHPMDEQRVKAIQSLGKIITKLLR